MHRFLYALLIGLVGAGLVHVAIVLMLPHFEAQRSWARVEDALPLHLVARLDESSLPILAGDPFLLSSVCRFDLRDGPLLAAARGRPAAWSAAVFAPEGRSLASLDDRMVPDGRLNLVLITPGQSRERALRSENAADGRFQVEAEAASGLLAVRVLVPDPSWRGLAEEFLSSLSCLTERPAQTQ